MDIEMMNEFYLLQTSRSNQKYIDLLDDHVYAPIVKANVNVTTWVSKRGHMLMHLEARMNKSIRRLRKKYLTF
jgi:macrodomain Ter protein organizer (MatP/YcbG family)